MTRCYDYFNTDHLRSTLKVKALRGTNVVLVAQLFTFGLGFGGTIILARLLSPNDFGLVAMVLTFSLLLQNISSNGFIEATIQRKEINHRQISTLFWINVCFSLMLSLLFIASAPIIAWFYKEPLLKPIVIAMAVSILLSGLSSQHQALLTRNMMFFKTSITEVVATLISVISSIILAYYEWGYWALVAKWVVSPLMIFGGVWFLCKWRPGLPAMGTGVKSLLSYAVSTSGNFAINHFGKNIDKILIGRYQSSQLLGSYSRAYHLSLMPANQLMAPLTGVSIATFSRLSHEPLKYRHSYLKMLSIMAFVCMPLSAVLTLVGKDLILLLLGPQWRTAGQIFTIFGASIGVMMIYHSHGWIHLSLGTPSLWFRWNIIAIAVTVLLFVIGLSFGVLGVAYAYSASFYILIVPALWYAGRPVDLKLSLIASAVWKYYLSALFAGLFCWFIFYSFGLTSNTFIKLSPLIKIIASVVLCLSVYLISLIAICGSTKPISDFLSFLRSFQKSKTL